ncbi:MAG: periplasmic heavy metal sensor [Desulfomonile tiedjei]|uniref:Periplasmic heavy metal sensor n=1 Tax=Desulfomonile tiedjei TaxID=2358 RepID=A0A9D6YZ71_9BACT|nr:periplasmic heavy metal sensor [Desulfomonile tiedjei]
MKRIIFIGLFIFSIVLNVAVAATLGWHIWNEGSFGAGSLTQEAPIVKEDLRQIRQAMSAQDRTALMETRQRVIDKNVELLDVIAKNPGNLSAAESKIKELAGLRELMERQALARISTVMASLPEEKRQAFVVVLKKRACMMPVMGYGRGGGRRGPGRGGMECRPTPGGE